MDVQFSGAIDFSPLFNKSATMAMNPINRQSPMIPMMRANMNRHDNMVAFNQSILEPANNLVIANTMNEALGANVNIIA